MIKTYRLKKAWSQEQLSEFSGVSVRTMQGLEKGGQGALETLKAIAATLEIDIQTLQSTPSDEEQTMQVNNVEQPLDPSAAEPHQTVAEDGLLRRTGERTIPMEAGNLPTTGTVPGFLFRHAGHARFLSGCRHSILAQRQCPGR